MTSTCNKGIILINYFCHSVMTVFHALEITDEIGSRRGIKDINVIAFYLCIFSYVWSISTVSIQLYIHMLVTPFSMSS